MSTHEIPGLLPAMSGLSEEQQRRLSVLRFVAAYLGLINRRDARYAHDDEHAMNRRATHREAAADAAMALEAFAVVDACQGSTVP